MQRPDSTNASTNTVAPTFTVLVYSDDPATRERVRLAVGRRPVRDITIDYVDVDTAEAVVETVDEGGVDLAILDGEAAPAGGMGICRQLKNEIAQCPLILILTGRRDDRWLATWSQADAAVSHPIDAIELSDVTVELLRRLQERGVVPASDTGVTIHSR